MIEQIKLTSKETTAVQFDGTFESAVNITNFVKEQSGFEKIVKFKIDHDFSGTELSFTALPPKNDPNARKREFTFRVGDFLILYGAGYDKLSGDFVRKFFLSTRQ